MEVSAEKGTIYIIYVISQARSDEDRTTMHWTKQRT